jgi:HK97 family phage prohead protease
MNRADLLARAVAEITAKSRLSRDVAELLVTDRLVRRELPGGAEVWQVEKSYAGTAACVREVKGDGDVVTIVASDATVDRYGDIIEPTGWKFANYLRNPVWLVDHRYTVLSIVGQGMNPRIEGGALVLDVRHDPPGSGEQVDGVRARLKSGSLRAVSVGFRPLKWEKIRNEQGDWTGGFRFLEQELLEVSWVAVPANPSATLGLGPEDLGPAPTREVGPVATSEAVERLTALNLRVLEHELGRA